MTNITQSTESYALAPEALEFTEVYLQTLDLEQTAKALDISKEQAATFLNKREVKRFIDTVFAEQGYMNRFKLTGLLEKVIESKLEEAEETGVYTGKDLVDILTLMHKIQMDHAKVNAENGPSKQTNVQVNNYGDNLGKLMERIVTGN